MQYLKQTDGLIVEFTPAFVSNESGAEIQVAAASGVATTKADYDKQQEKIEKLKEVAAKETQDKHEAKKAAIEKIAKTSGLTLKEIKSLLS
jgi:hypothetical protein